MLLQYTDLFGFCLQHYVWKSSTIARLNIFFFYIFIQYFVVLVFAIKCYIVLEILCV